jgi:hypothetical protein
MTAAGPSTLGAIESPWNFRARRFIEAPVYRLCGSRKPHPSATRWRLEMEQDGVRHRVENDQPILDAAPMWPKLRVGAWIQATLYEIDAATGWCVRVHSLGASVQGNGTMIGLVSKAPDWDDRDDAPLDYRASIAANLDWFDRQERLLRTDDHDPAMPAWWWYASESEYPARRPPRDGAFPGLASVAIVANLSAARALPERAKSCRATARAIGDWLLAHRTPFEGATPGMPYTAMRKGTFTFSAEAQALNISRAFVPAAGLLELYRETGEERYLDYARHVAGVLTRFVGDDGAMPYRVRPDTGQVMEAYTCGSVGVALLLDALEGVDPDARWRDASRRIRGWVLDHPMRDFNWKACFEDVGRKPRFANLTGMDALWAVRLLVGHRDEDPAYLPAARKLFRWVEDQFVSFGDDVSLGRLRTFYPAVREQYDCDYPMEAHAANYASTCRAMLDATSEPVFRHKLVATLNAIVRSQREDGAYSTWGRDRETGFGGFTSGHNWFNCNHGAMGELSSYLIRQAGGTALML